MPTSTSAPVAAAGLILLLAAAAYPAAAQDAAPLTAEQSASLDRAIRLWTGAPADARPLYTVTPEGDHYRLEKPVDLGLAMPGSTLQGGKTTALVRLLGGGSWQFDDVNIALPITVTTPATKNVGAIRLTIDAKGQSGRLTIDPTLATQSISDGSATDLSGTVAVEPKQSGSFRVGRATSHSDWQPAGGGRVDQSSALAMDDISAAWSNPKLDAAARKFEFHAEAKGLLPDQMAKIKALLGSIRAADQPQIRQQDKPPAPPPPAADMAPGAPTPAVPQTSPAQAADTAPPGTASPAPQVGRQDEEPPPPPPAADNAPGAPTPGSQPPPAGAADLAPSAGKRGAAPSPGPKLTADQRRAFRDLLDSLRGVGSSLEASERIDDLAVAASGHTLSLHVLGLSAGIAAPGGRGDLHVRLVAEGLASTEIPPGIARAYLPHRVVLAPHVTGLPLDKLLDLLDRALDGKPPQPQERAALTRDLLAGGPISAGLDELSFDLGPASVHATGAVQAADTRPSDLSGLAEIVAHGFAALIEQANADPMLKQVAPVLLMLKGLGREHDDGSLTWKVAYNDGKLLVNDVDLSQVMPHR